MNNTAGHHTLHEILTQPEAWAAALAVLQEHSNRLRQFFRKEHFNSVIITGCGTSYYLALAASAAWQELAHIPARGIPSSEIWLYHQTVLVPKQKTLLVVASRSGETTEALRACETFRMLGMGAILTLTCYPDSALATTGDLNIVLPSGQEESIAQTRAFTTLYIATVMLAALYADRGDLWLEFEHLPDVAQRLLRDYRTLVEELGRRADLDRFYFLGSGIRYGLACELSLKMKEMSLSHSEPFHFLEFRHGPQSMVTSTTLVIGLVSETNRSHERAVLEEMRNRGAHILAIDEIDSDVKMTSGVGELARSILCHPAGQLLAYYHAISRGLDPDRPNNLTAVVKLE